MAKEKLSLGGFKKAPTEVRGKVYQTYNYNLFTFVKGNREPNQAWINKLAEKMKAGFIDVPIVVNSKYQILDGQHRYFACMQLEKPITFYVSDDAEDLHVAHINADSKKFTTTNYMDFFAIRGNQHYKYVKYLAEKKNLGTEVAILALSRRCTRSSTMMEDFKAGYFKVVDFGWAEQFADHYNELIDLIGKKARTRVFLNVFLIFYKHPEFEFKRFLHAVKTNLGSIDKCTDRYSTIRTLEYIYNKQLKGKKYHKIKFQRYIEDKEYFEVTEKELARREAIKSRSKQKER